LACAALLSFNWAEQRVVLLGIESAQGADRLTIAPPRIAEAARRHYRRSVYGHGLFDAAVAATTSPWNYDDYYCYGDPYSFGGHAPGSYYFGSYPGGYCVSRSYVTGLYGRPTLFPRYYEGRGW
jgi:hypothetical protein